MTAKSPLDHVACCLALISENSGRVTAREPPTSLRLRTGTSESPRVVIRPDGEWAKQCALSNRRTTPGVAAS